MQYGAQLTISSQAPNLPHADLYLSRLLKHFARLLDLIGRHLLVER